MINSPPTVLPFVKAGKVRALAVTGAQRSPGLPDLPTIRESGFPITRPTSGTGCSRRQRRRRNRRTAQPGGCENPQGSRASRAHAGSGAELVGNSPEEFGRFVRAEMDKWGALARRINLRVD